MDAAPHEIIVWPCARIISGVQDLRNRSGLMVRAAGSLRPR
jgi:hypothetical protein